MTRIGSRFLGTLLFLCGALVGTGFFGAAVLADFEASLFNPSIRGATTLRTLTCPIVLTPGEVGIARASFHNPGPNPTSPTVRATTSYRSVVYLDEDDRRFLIEPGESVTMEWEIHADNVTWGLFVFFRLYQFASYPLQSASGYCGILVLDVPYLSGRAIEAAAIALSLLCMAAGLWLRRDGNGQLPRHRRAITRAMAAMGVLVTLGIAAAMLGRWLPGMIVLVLVLVLAVVMSAMAFSAD